MFACTRLHALGTAQGPCGALERHGLHVVAVEQDARAALSNTGPPPHRRSRTDVGGARTPYTLGGWPPRFSCRLCLAVVSLAMPGSTGRPSRAMPGWRCLVRLGDLHERCLVRRGDFPPFTVRALNSGVNLSPERPSLPTGVDESGHFQRGQEDGFNNESGT